MLSKRQVRSPTAARLNHRKTKLPSLMLLRSSKPSRNGIKEIAINGKYGNP
jgi:hypothetical protein